MPEWSQWNSVRGEANCWVSELTQEVREPGVRRTTLLETRTVIGYGPGYVRMYSTFLGDNIPAGVTMTYAEALSLDKNLRGIVKVLSSPL